MAKKTYYLKCVMNHTNSKVYYLMLRMKLNYFSLFGLGLYKKNLLNISI